METGKIVKINLLSIVAIPILIASTLVRLISNVMERIATIILGFLVAFAGAQCLNVFKDVRNNYVNGGSWGLLLIGGIIFVALGVALVGGVSGLLAGTSASIARVFLLLHQFLHWLYSATFLTCKEDVESLSGEESEKRRKSPFFSLLKGVYRGVLFLSKHALATCIVSFVGSVLFAVYEANLSVMDQYHCTLLERAKVWTSFDWVFNGYIAVCFFAVFLYVFITLGIEWQEWSFELQAASGVRFQNQVKDPDEWTETAQCIDLFSELNEEHEDFMDLVSAFLRRDLYIHLEVETLFQRYKEGFVEMMKLFYRHGYVVTDKWASSFNEKVLSVATLREDILQRLDGGRRENQNDGYSYESYDSNESYSSDGLNEGASFGGDVFFSGCETEEQLQKRYRMLSKAFHPDSESGDEETFKQMKDEYERKLKSLKK